MSKSFVQKENKKEVETWRDIKGYEGRYQVSNMGRVKSLSREVASKNGSKQYRKERILKPRSNGKGYLRVSLCKSSSETKDFYIHRLVCEAFHENPMNRPDVNHINEDKSDNRACNLEWVTRKGNCNFGTRNTRVAKALSKPVGQYTQEGELVKVWQSTREVERQLGFCHSHINLAAKGKQKTSYGYVWKYIKEEK